MTRTGIVAPSRIEEILLAHRDVKQAVVCGVPEKSAQAEDKGEEKRHQHIRAYIVKGQEAELTEEDVLQYLQESGWDVHTAMGGVKFVASIPKTSVCSCYCNLIMFSFGWLSCSRTTSPYGDFYSEKTTPQSQRKRITLGCFKDLAGIDMQSSRVLSKIKSMPSRIIIFKALYDDRIRGLIHRRCTLHSPKQRHTVVRDGTSRACENNSRRE